MFEVGRRCVRFGFTLVLFCKFGDVFALICIAA